MGELAYHVASVYLLKRQPSMKLRLLRNYVGFVAALGLSSLSAGCGIRAEYLKGVLLSLFELLVFFMIARYTVEEVRRMAVLLATPRVWTVGRVTVS
jgi:hypothetical protein